MPASDLARMLRAELKVLQTALSEDLGRFLQAFILELGPARDVSLVFELEGHLIWEKFPVSMIAFDREGWDQSLVSTERTLLEGKRFLEGVEAYPLGRHDLFGWNTNPDLAAVEAELSAAIRTAAAPWQRKLQLGSISAYVGRSEDPDAENPINYLLRELFTGRQLEREFSLR